MKKAFRNKLTSKNLENLLFLPLNKYKPFDYQKLAFILIKNWKYKVEILKFHFKVLTFSQAFVHKALRPKISTNFDDIDTLEVSKIIFVNFCIHFCKYFLSLSVSQKFLTHKRKKKNRKNNLFFGKDFTWFLTKKKFFSRFFLIFFQKHQLWRQFI